MTLEQDLQVLKKIARSFPRNSKEYKTLVKAAKLMMFLEDVDVCKQFEHFIKNIHRPLTGIELIKLKSYGLEIPNEYRSSKILELESEIDALVAKILSLDTFDQ
jgi:hypothetical protein